jgi:hypothetical protein
MAMLNNQRVCMNDIVYVGHKQVEFNVYTPNNSWKMMENESFFLQKYLQEGLGLERLGLEPIGFRRLYDRKRIAWKLTVSGCGKCFKPCCCWYPPVNQDSYR